MDSKTKLTTDAGIQAAAGMTCINAVGRGPRRVADSRDGGKFATGKSGTRSERTHGQMKASARSRAGPADPRTVTGGRAN